MTNLADTFVTTASGFPVYVNAVAPLNPQIGMAWHSVAGGLQVWNGTAWVSVGGGGSAAVDTQQVVMAPNVAGIGAAWTALASPPTLSGEVTFGLFGGDIYVLTDEANPGTNASWLQLTGTGRVNVPTVAPTAPATGSLWYNAAAVPPGIQMWSGTAWLPVGAPAVTVAAVAPVTPASGHFWLDTSGTAPVLKLRNGAAWITVGDVVGPATATDNAVARFDGITGKLIQNSGVIVDDTNNVSGVQSIAVTANANNAVVASTGVMNLAAAQMFTHTSTAVMTWSFTNVPTARGTTVVLRLTNGGAFAQTWPTSVKWPNGLAPPLTAAGKDVLVFVTVDGGTTWDGNIFAKDAK